MRHCGPRRVFNAVRPAGLRSTNEYVKVVGVELVVAGTLSSCARVLARSRDVAHSGVGEGQQSTATAGFLLLATHSDHNSLPSLSRANNPLFRPLAALCSR